MSWKDYVHVDDVIVYVATRRRIVLKYGPKRRILACANQSVVPSLLGVPSGPDSLQVQSDALRSQHRTKGVHQISQSNPEEIAVGGNRHVGLFR